MPRVTGYSFDDALSGRDARPTSALSTTNTHGNGEPPQKGASIVNCTLESGSVDPQLTTANSNAKKQHQRRILLHRSQCNGPDQPDERVEIAQVKYFTGRMTVPPWPAQ